MAKCCRSQHCEVATHFRKTFLNVIAQNTSVSQREFIDAFMNVTLSTGDYLAILSDSYVSQAVSPFDVFEIKVQLNSCCVFQKVVI
jgi:hypothetical protein